MEVAALLAEHSSIHLTAVGSGSAAVAADVQAELLASADFPSAMKGRFNVMADPSKELYQQFGLNRGVVATLKFKRPLLNLKGLLQFPFQCCCRGRLPGVNAGDPWQQGGIFVLPPNSSSPSEALYALRETSPGYPLLDTDAFLAAAKQAVAEPASAEATRAAKAAAQ